MGTGNTGEVFLTNAPTTANTYWRLFHGGTNSSFERGQLFAEPGNSTFNINAPQSHLLFHTLTRRRARINGKVTTHMGPGDPFLNITRDGFMMLSGQADAYVNTASRAPFSRLHLVDDETQILNPVVYAQEHGYRPWQKNGITFTGNSDQGYIGHKYKGNDNTDFVVQWSDNPESSPYGTDRMKFVFTTRYDPGTPRGAATYDGVEAMRFWPKEDLEVNVGVGDFAPPSIGDPTERLDILDGRLRIRMLPDDDEADAEFKVMVVDDSSDPIERGVVKWKDLSLIGGGCSSGWTLNGTDAVTAYDGNPCPPLAADRVGIGATFPLLGKLHVEHDGSGGTAHNGIYTKVVGGTSANAIETETFGATGTNRGVFAKATGGSNAMGVIGSAVHGTINNMSGQFHANNGQYATGVEAVAAGASGFNIGTKSNASYGDVAYGISASALFGSSHNYAVRGSVSNLDADPWAGYFIGDVYGSGGLLTPSDAQLKQNIAELEGGLDVILSLQPKSYSYRTEEFAVMSLPDGPQAGLLAQDVEAVLPTLVRSVHQPAELDSVGQEISASIDFKAVKMEGVIPYLVASIQAQQAMIAELQERVESCCAAQDGMTPHGSDHGGISPQELLKEQKLRIIPNPVANITRLEYFVPAAGKVSLELSSSDGKPLMNLRQEIAQEGEHTYFWNTTGMAAGTYLCTYVLDGHIVVQRAIKVD